MILLIPESLVALIIGVKGNKIKSLQRESFCNIMVSQPIANMAHRTVIMKGIPSDMSKAVTLIYRNFTDYHEKPTEPINLDKVKTTGKVVLNTECVGFIIGREGHFTKRCSEKYDVYMKIVNSTARDLVLRHSESIALMTGRLKDVLRACEELVDRQDQYYTEQEQNYKPGNDQCRLLIPKQYVSKLIGQAGCLIKNISQKSGGAQISILSDKRRVDANIKETLVEILGNVEQKKKAVRMVLEYIELFRAGGPVLSSEKALSTNLVAQFETSIKKKEGDKSWDPDRE